jgi:eukaryotic-like serine/threonine-protein kinase
MEKHLPLNPGEDTSADEQPADLWATADYDVREELGAGAMGVVYKAQDRRNGQFVALKRMSRFSPDALIRFKNEGSILQDIRHPNLVPLYDLVSAGQQWFFTMQLIEGGPFLKYVRVDHETTSEELESAFSRLRAAFRQLAAGILTLHEHDFMHRDVKPSNVLATARGQVVLLDFGLAQSVAPDDRSVTGGITGTLLYMPPEQFDGDPGMASDWYSFGVVLFEALTGKHPFSRTPYAMPSKRQNYHPPLPHTLAPDVPVDLSQLCVELLHPDPGARPSGQEVCRRLDPAGLAASSADLSAQARRRPASLASVFLGREKQLADLAEARADAQTGRTITVLLHGQSGVGKSALVKHFLAPLKTERAVCVLAGRCYERASVPYKALDGLVDSLSRFWRSRPLAEAAALLPDGLGPLVRIFPVLQSVEAVAGEIQRLSQRGAGDLADPHELRRRAFAALREVLARIGRRWQLVLHLDDLQWGDVDSALMLADLLLPPEPPPLLLLACFRTEDRDTSPFLRTFTEAHARALTPRDWRELPLGVLTFEEARDLAGRLLEGVSAAPTAAEEVARESGCNPFFVWQLVQAVQAGDTDLTLGGLIWRRVAALAEGPRRLLEVIAVAGRPLDPSVALHAAGLADEEGRNSLIDLQSPDARILRAIPAGQHEVETYHDRIRETVFAHLTPEERKHHHLRLAIALEASRRADPEVLAAHYEGAEDRERASLYAARAAERAEEAFAFDRAAELYRRALALAPGSAEGSLRLQQRLGDALANAGRGAEAAEAYLAIVPNAGPGHALDLQRRAAEQFLRAGHIEEGLDLFRMLLRHVGISYPETNGHVFRQLLYRRVLLWWRGTTFRQREANQIPTEELTRIDVLFSVALVLSLVDPLRAMALRVQFSLLALHVGEPRRAALALGWIATHQAFCTVARKARVEALLRQAEALAEQVNDSYTQAVIDSMRGASAHLLGQWKECFEVLERTETLLRTKCTGTAWELGACYHYRFTAMRWLGMWKRFSRELPPVLREARERGDLFTTTNLLIHSAVIHLAADEPDKALQAVAEALTLWPARGFHLQHYHALWLEAETALYSGEAAHGWELVQQRWRALQQSLLLHIQVVRLTLLQLRARCALAAATTPGSAAPSLLRAVERDVRLIERERTPRFDACARLIRAGLASLRGNVPEAVRLLGLAEDGFRAGDMALYAASAQYRRGRLVGGEEGRRLIASALETMTNQEIRNPARLLNVFAPGFPGTE